MDGLKVEIGPGTSPLGPEWTTVDAVAGPGVDHIARWGIDSLPLPDDSCSLVYASHVIEHLPWYQTVDALREVRRCLKDGAKVELHTVDFEVVVSYFQQGKCDGWWAHNPDHDPTLWAAGRIFAYEKEGQGYNWHKAIFTEKHLGNCFKKAGFRSWKRIGLPRGKEKHGVINLGMEATK
jgi:ubiquinone/menaquinone biosynthesis C-methylase UbiE